MTEDLDSLKKVSDEALANFSNAQVFVDWFKDHISDAFRVHYNFGRDWILNADVGSIVSWLRQGTWNEWAASSIIAKMLLEFRNYVDTEFLQMFAQQIADESRHWVLRYNVLRAFGGNLDNFTPMPEWVELFDLPFRSARADPEHSQLRFTSTFQVFELTSVYHHRAVSEHVESNPQLKEKYANELRLTRENFREIEDDELFHWTIAERTWLKYCNDVKTRRLTLDVSVDALKTINHARKRRNEMAALHAI